MAQEADVKAQTQKEAEAPAVAAPPQEVRGLSHELAWSMSDSIVVKRLIRNLRYRQTYIEVYQAFQEPGLNSAVVRLLSSLTVTQQTAVVTLSSYLRGLSVDTQDLPPKQELMEQAAQRQGVSSRLHFVHYGLKRAVSWYGMQLTDRQMTGDPELRRILFELGQSEAAKLWHTEAVMMMLGILRDSVPKRPRGSSYAEQDQSDRWHSRLMDSSRRPSWSGGQPSIRAGLSRSGSDG
jgi:hypothetical protein